MRRYLLSLLDESEFLEHLTVGKIETGLVVAALSNVTRFPLSNIIHEIRNRDKSMFSGLSKEKILDAVFRITSVKGGKLPELIQDRFPNVALEYVRGIILKRSDSFDDENIFLCSLLNCSLDVRVIDFVRRDAHHLGIISGDTFTLEEILPHFTVHDHQLALKIDGVSVAEQIIALRYWLFSRVYWNKPNRTFFAMVRWALMRLREIDGFEERFAKKVLASDQDSLLCFLKDQAQESEDARLRDMVDRLVKGEERKFKVALEVCRKDDPDFVPIMDKLESFNHQQLDEMAEQVNVDLGEIFDGVVSTAEQVLLFDYPYEPGSTKLGQDIPVTDKQGNVISPLHEISGMVGGINQSFGEHLTKFRIFMNPDFLPPTERRGDLEELLKKSVADGVRRMATD